MGKKEYENGVTSKPTSCKFSVGHDRWWQTGIQSLAISTNGNSSGSDQVPAVQGCGNAKLDRQHHHPLVDVRIHPGVLGLYNFLSFHSRVQKQRFDSIAQQKAHLVSHFPVLVSCSVPPFRIDTPLSRYFNPSPTSRNFARSKSDRSPPFRAFLLFF